jgi:two-component system chemotaxis response regulator CheY
MAEWRVVRSVGEPEPMCKILVVDDEVGIREVLRVTLSGVGHEVREAENGRVALDLLADDPEDPPCIMLVDLRMPVMDGWDLLAALQAGARSKGIPVIVFSASINNDSPKPLLRARAYWPKPPPLEQLERIHEHCVEHGEPGRSESSIRRRSIEPDELDRPRARKANEQ